jgi:pellino protein
MEERVINVPSLSKTVPSLYKSIGSTHSVSICLNKHERGYVEFTQDATKDMFQIGRAPSNDVILNGLNTSHGSAMSRYSCRIDCQRSEPFECRIYAGGFDEENELFLGESALTWGTQMDALITNGVRICDGKLTGL